MADRSTKVILTAQVQGYVEGMQKAAQATREAGSETEKLAQQQQAFESMGRASMVAGGAIAAGLALSTKAAIDWDTAWAGVTKTVDGSDAQMSALEKGLRDLSGTLPASHAEIAAVAEAAGQLGIETPNVVAFTKTMIDLGETTNLSSDQAATSLARFTNIMGTSQAEVSNLGSALVDLGNNYATTEAEIMEMAMRLAGAGAQIGMSEGQVLGLSTALSSVGIEAEAGGSAMSKVMIDIESSVQRGGDRLQQFAEVSGMSAQAFAEKWRSDPGEALAAFVSGLQNAESQGKSTIGILDELGITEVRMRDALLRSSAAADQFSGAMKKGNQAFEENTALADEAEKRYETTAAKLGMMRNKVVDAAISLGAELLPAVEGVADGIGSFADTLSGLDGPIANMVAWGGVVAGGILLTGGVAMAAVPKIAAYKVALETLGVSTAGVSGKLKGLKSFLMGGWGLGLAVGALAVHQFNAALDGSKVSAQEMENALKQGAGALEEMQAKASQNEGGFAKAFIDVEQHLENLPALADKAAESGRGFFSSMTFNENAALDSIREFGNALSTLSASDLPRAQEAFAAFVNDSGLSDAQALTLMNEEMAVFKGSLIDAAEAAGIATDDATLLKFAMGEIKPAAEEGADGAEAQASSLEELAGVASETSDEVSKLADEIRNFGETSFNVEEAAIRLQEEYRKLAGIFDEGKGSLDITTEAGAETARSLMDIASAANESAAATLAAGGSQEEMNGILSAARERIIEARIALGEDRTEAEAWADSKVASGDAVKAALDRVTGAANSIPENTKANVSTNALGPVAQLNSVTSSANRIPKEKKVVVEAAVDRAIANLDGVLGWLARIPAVKNVAVQILESRTSKNADGGLYAYANGGIAAYAGGGFATGIYSGGAPIHKFAEPETGWEAYISGKPSERDRNRQIWQETGRRLGVESSGPTQVVAYVQNPFTGKYLLSKVDQVANAAVDGFVAQQAREGRRAGY